MQDFGFLAVFKVTARDQGHYKGPSGAFVTYCIISCLFSFFLSNAHNSVPKEDQRKIAIVAHSWNRVCLSPLQFTEESLILLYSLATSCKNET